MTYPEVLGAQEWQSGWRLAAVPALQEVIDLSRQLIAFVGMAPDGPPDVRHYPTEAGGGGEGVQVYQPLVESWLVISTWPAHGFTRVNLSSCKRFDHGAVSSYLGRIGSVLIDWQNKL
jgi:hypothetical protein